jgi:hypothetical protein
VALPWLLPNALQKYRWSDPDPSSLSSANWKKMSASDPIEHRQ